MLRAHAVVHKLRIGDGEVEHAARVEAHRAVGDRDAAHLDPPHRPRVVGRRQEDAQQLRPAGAAVLGGLGRVVQRVVGLVVVRGKQHAAVGVLAEATVDAEVAQRHVLQLASRRVAVRRAHHPTSRDVAVGSTAHDSIELVAIDIGEQRPVGAGRGHDERLLLSAARDGEPLRSARGRRSSERPGRGGATRHRRSRADRWSLEVCSWAHRPVDLAVSAVACCRAALPTGGAPMETPGRHRARS